MKVMKWIEVKKRLPPVDAAVLVAVWDGRKGVEMYYTAIKSRLNASWFDDHTGDELKPKDGTVTHWMPLPDDPIKEDLVDE